MYYVYLLELENGEYYAGYTKNLKDRIDRHNRKTTKFTKSHKVKKLVFYYASFCKKETALNFEKYLKTSSGKAFRNKRLL